jgi:3-deoxy-D-manno-octulosonic acid kinase
VTSPMAESRNMQTLLGGVDNGSNIVPRIEKLDSGYILYDSGLLAKPFSGLFDTEKLAERGFLDGPTVGRGGGYFLRFGSQEWVWRHYRRGGIIAKVLADEFVGWRLDYTRSWMEWRLLADLYGRGFPVPRPVAAFVSRKFGYYRCDLITQRIAPAQNLSALLEKAPLPAEVWVSIGACVRRFHNAGIYHADLNANNVLLDDQMHVYLIDFDRSGQRRGGLWQRKNIARFKRSLEKIAKLSPNYYFNEDGFRLFLSGYNAGF